MLRTFIAIELNREIRDKLGSLQDKLKSGAPDVKWVITENIHLTLKFLGQTEENKIDPIKNVLNALASKFEAFSLEISNLGAFPNLSSPRRVIWIETNPRATNELELKSNRNILLDMVKMLEQELEKLGFPKEKRAFQPHITIGRVRSSKNLNILRTSLQNNLNFEAGTLKVTQISLVQSTLTPSGPIYTVIHNAGLS